MHPLYRTAQPIVNGSEIAIIGKATRIAPPTSRSVPGCIYALVLGPSIRYRKAVAKSGISSRGPSDSALNNTRVPSDQAIKSASINTLKFILNDIRNIERSDNDNFQKQFSINCRFRERKLYAI